MTESHTPHGGDRPSLAVISRAAGVSQATVSRVLRGRSGVSEASRRAVQVALSTLGMIDGVPHADTHPAGVPKLAIVQRSPLSAEIDRFERFGIEILRQAASRGVTCLRCYVDAQTDWSPESLTDLGVSGVVALGAGGPARLAGRCAAAGLPTALVATIGAWDAALDQGSEATGDDAPQTAQRNEPGRAPEPTLVPGPVPVQNPASFVAPTRYELDDIQGARTALRHLLQLGHTRIGLAAAVGPTTPAIVAEFRRGLAAGLHIVATRDQAPVALSEPTLVAGASAGETLLDAGCTAVVSCSPALSFGVLEATRRRSLRIPEHLSLITVGEMPDAEVLGPPLSQVAYDWQLLAAEVVNGLAQNAGSASGGPGPGYRIEPDLILRGSQASLRRR